jgi:hypothetical protein
VKGYLEGETMCASWIADPMAHLQENSETVIGRLQLGDESVDSGQEMVCPRH